MMRRSYPRSCPSNALTRALIRVDDTQATAWLKSFAISVATSAIVLQTLKALIGGTVASMIGSLAVVSAVIAFSVSAVSIQ